MDSFRSDLIIVLVRALDAKQDVRKLSDLGRFPIQIDDVPKSKGSEKLKEGREWRLTQ